MQPGSPYYDFRGILELMYNYSKSIVFSIYLSRINIDYVVSTSSSSHQNRQKIWRLCCVAVGALSILTFTPLVIPPGIYKPMLAGIPLTLWSGILIVALLVILTGLGALYHPGRDREESESV